MQIKVRHYGHDGEKSVVEVIDPSDGAVTHSAELVDGQQITVTATTAHSPADIEFGEVEAIPVAEPERGEESHQDSPGVPGPSGDDSDSQDEEREQRAFERRHEDDDEPEGQAA